MTIWWSMNYIFAKYALREFPPLLASGIRMIIAGVIMLGIYRWKRAASEIPPWNFSDVKMLVSLGVVGVGLNQLFFVLGMSMTTVSHAAIVIGLTPVLVLLLASITGLERLTALKLAGMGTALAGVAVLQGGPARPQGSTLLGDACILLASLTFAVFTVRSKRETSRLGGVVVNTFAYAGTAIAMLPVTLSYSVGFEYANVTWVAWASLLYMAVFPSVICYSIFYYALTHIPASRVTAFSYLQPVLATTMAIPLLGEAPTKSLLFGGALVLTGVFLAERG